MYPSVDGMRQSHAAPPEEKIHARKRVCILFQKKGEDRMQISFIGAGKVGVSLGKYFISKGRKVGGYYSLSPESAAWAANFTHTKQYQSIKEIISSSDMIFFTVPDDRIREVWESARPYTHGKIIAHCSGIHSSNIFSDIDRTGSMAYSIHPLCAISDRETSWQVLGDVLFTIEGDARNISNIQDMFTQMGNRTCFISAENKIKYHAAASLASNHMTAVFFMAQKLFLECGFTEQQANEELYRLAKGNLENIHAQGCIASLTGPVERGDKNTVQKHLDALNADMKKAYLENAKKLLEIAEQKNPDRDYAAMKEVFMPTKIEKSCEK